MKHEIIWNTKILTDKNNNKVVKSQQQIIMRETHILVTKNYTFWVLMQSLIKNVIGERYRDSESDRSYFGSKGEAFLKRNL